MFAQLEQSLVPIDDMAVLIGVGMNFYNHPETGINARRKAVASVP